MLLKGVVSREFLKDTINPISLDWKGKFATAYDFKENKANILVFNGKQFL